MSKNSVVLGLALITALGLGSGLQRSRVFLNGTETTDVLFQGGKTYVSVLALRQAGAEVTNEGNRVAIRFDPPVGREQADAVEGRRGEWIHNGTWRIQVREVSSIPNPFGRGRGYAVVLEMRNLKGASQSGLGTGLDKIQVIDSAGNILSVAASGDYSKVYDSVPPGGGIVMNLRFGDPRNQLADIGEADKLLVLFRSSGGKPALKHFRVFLRDE